MTESNRIEYKQELTDGLEREVVAFLNSHEGGIIWLGIDKTGLENGLENADAVQLKIKDFRVTDNFLRMTLPNAVAHNTENVSSKSGQTGGLIGGSIGGQIPLTTRQQQILALIKNNPYISRTEMAQQLKINESAIQKHLVSLKNKGVLKQIGGTRGYWQVNLPE